MTAASNPGAEITAIDVSANSIQIAKERCSQFDGICFIQADACNWSDGTRYDMIVCSGVVHHVADPLSIINTIGKHASDHACLFMMLYSPVHRQVPGQVRRAVEIINGNALPTDLNVQTARLIVQSALPGTRIARMYQVNGKVLMTDDEVADEFLHPYENNVNPGEILRGLASFAFHPTYFFGPWRWQHWTSMPLPSLDPEKMIGLIEALSCGDAGRLEFWASNYRTPPMQSSKYVLAHGVAEWAGGFEDNPMFQRLVDEGEVYPHSVTEQEELEGLEKKLVALRA